jgi:hypothetical protein
MAHKQRRQAGQVTAGDFCALVVRPVLPTWDHYLDRRADLFARLRGAEIIAIGAPYSEDIEIEGGGLALDYRLRDGSTHRVIGFNENGMWVEHERAISTLACEPK